MGSHGIRGTHRMPCGVELSHADGADFRRTTCEAKFLCISVISVCNDFWHKYWIGAPKTRAKITIFQTSVFQLFISLLYRRTNSSASLCAFAWEKYVLMFFCLKNCVILFRVPIISAPVCAVCVRKLLLSKNLWAPCIRKNVINVCQFQIFM